MTKNFSDCNKINKILATNFSDICSIEPKILLIFHINFLILLENLPYYLPKIFSKFSVNFVQISFSKFSEYFTRKFH